MTSISPAPQMADMAQENVAAVRAGLANLERHVRNVREVYGLPCVVAVTSADGDKPGSGSGVIISKEGLILTAAHVTQATGNQLTIIFPDGRRVKGTLF